MQITHCSKALWCGSFNHLIVFTKSRCYWYEKHIRSRKVQQQIDTTPAWDGHRHNSSKFLPFRLVWFYIHYIVVLEVRNDVLANPTLQQNSTVVTLWPLEMIALTFYDIEHTGMAKLFDQRAMLMRVADGLDPAWIISMLPEILFLETFCEWKMQGNHYTFASYFIFFSIHNRVMR